MPEKVIVAKTSDIPPGESRAFPCGDRMIAIFHIDNHFYAMDDFCPHQGASLAGGWVHEGCVACPWHAWRFRLDDGTWLDNPKIKTDIFPVTIQDDDIYIELPGSGS